jgi:hypothetical protein
LPPTSSKAIKLEPAQVVAISGRSISRDKHLWGDIATQLGGVCGRRIMVKRIFSRGGWSDGRKKRAPKRGKRTPIGERVQFLMMMHPDVTADIKQVAIEEHRAAWDVVEQAAREFLRRRKPRKIET